MVDVSKIKFRLNKAQECIDSAEADIKLGHLYSSANRSYYAIYSSIRATLELDNYESTKHSGNISEFRKLYIKTGIFDAILSNFIRDAFAMREKCDYTDHFVAMLPDVTQQLENAKQFYKKVQQYIETNISM